MGAIVPAKSPRSNRTWGGSNTYTEPPRQRDHQDRGVLLVNEQFPGPLVEGNWGDRTEVRVNNLLTKDPAEGTAIHWHRFPQHGTPWMGTARPGVPQFPITPSGDFTYRFCAEIYSTSWYHFHYSAQDSGELYGPMVVRGPNSVDSITVNGLLHVVEVVEEVMVPGFPGQTHSDSNPISGRMNLDNSKAATAARTAESGNSDGTTTKNNNTTATGTDNAGLRKSRFQSGKRHRLRFTNS
ncbi:hypothetical protein DL766_009981 [Monosporascus sp. MC13-8B]|uniref:Plastocyanin-like domain-containing protein n=1 Tax=Monosporascus cannonballus TaxID=155416 RepID=A0ABY0HE23_9PEZI|nr:hypothetical protein DL762_003752 [Monosporascus cannonballus]RYO96320.1 hypothetical protein DL763_003293 [Monosporascus cannonballus]RYP12265.1 hypothetical protein DL766_009981 [Monosporascus sp. MC13-8B]